jgi:predicted TIM-barrel fold metal-dependent hydrolase
VAVNQGPHSLERYLRPMIQTYPNLYVETSYYIIEGAIEEFCARYGPERMLFGTAFPDNCSGGAVLQLLHADIPDAAKQAIAAGNLQRLIEEARP